VSLFGLEEATKVFIYGQACDMRIGFDGLVQDQMPLDPRLGYLFFSVNRTRIKILHWNNDGLALFHKRLERGTFKRQIVLGRKNYLFAGSHEGAQRSAMFYTFFGNCKINNINPEKWLEYIITNISELKVSQLHELFPQNLTNEKLDQIIRLQDM
jgi:hypothetical protein